MNLLDKIFLARAIRPAPVNTAKPVWVGGGSTVLFEPASSGGGGGGGGGGGTMTAVPIYDRNTVGQSWATNGEKTAWTKTIAGNDIGVNNGVRVYFAFGATGTSGDRFQIKLYWNGTAVISSALLSVPASGSIQGVGMVEVLNSATNAQLLTLVLLSNNSAFPVGVSTVAAAVDTTAPVALAWTIARVEPCTIFAYYTVAELMQG